MCEVAGYGRGSVLNKIVDDKSLPEAIIPSLMAVDAGSVCLQRVIKITDGKLSKMCKI